MSINTKKVTDSVAVILARDEIQHYFDGSDVEQFLIIPWGDESIRNASLADFIMELITIKNTSDIGKAEELVALIERLFVSDLQSALSLMRQIRMIAFAKQEVLTVSQWLTTEDLLKLEGFNINDPDVQSDDWVAGPTD